VRQSTGSDTRSDEESCKKSRETPESPDIVTVPLAACARERYTRMRNRPTQLRVILAAAAAAAGIAAAAGCSAQSSSAFPASGSRASSPAAPAASSYTLTSASRGSARLSAAAVCVTSAQMGHCQFGRYWKITGASTDPYVDQNVWNPISGWHQTLHAINPGHWYVVANMPAGNTAVVSFPNTGFSYNRRLSKFSSLISAFTDSIPRRSGTNAEASYDIWFSNTGVVHEVMIQNDYSPGRGPGCASWTAKRVKFGGSEGVPAHRWDLCVSGSTAYWETATGNMVSGRVNVLAMLKWLVRHGQLPGRVHLTGFSYGFEISSTGSRNEEFRVTHFTAAARR